MLTGWGQTYGQTSMPLGYAMSICEGGSWIILGRMHV